jgi:hypothetical protein
MFPSDKATVYPPQVPKFPVGWSHPSIPVIGRFTLPINFTGKILVRALPVSVSNIP